MKKLLLLTCIGMLSTGTAFGEEGNYSLAEDSNREEMAVVEAMAESLGETYEAPTENRYSYKFDLWHETDKVRSSDNSGDVTDIGTSFTITDNETNLFFMYELLTTSITKDGSERDRHNFRIGQNDMFTLGGFTVTPYYQFRYEDHSEGGTSERFQHRLGYGGANDHGVSFWGYSSYDSFDGRQSDNASGPDQSGYYGEHEVLYSFDFGQGVLTTSVFNEYQTLTYSSFNNTQARAEYMHPMAEGFTFGPFTEIDLHRRGTDRVNDYKFGNKDTNKVYAAGVRGNIAISEQWSSWSEVSWNFVESDDDVLYIETGLSYRF